MKYIIVIMLSAILPVLGCNVATMFGTTALLILATIMSLLIAIIVHFEGKVTTNLILMGIQRHPLTAMQNFTFISLSYLIPLEDSACSICYLIK